MRLVTSLLRCCGFLLIACCLFAQSPELVEKSHHARDLMAEGKYAEAVPLYRDLARQLPKNPGPVLNLGLALHMSGQEKQAIAEFEQVLKVDPHNVPAELYLGYAYLSLGNPGKAIAPLEKVVQAAPDEFDARMNLASALLSLNRFDASKREFRRLSETNAESAKVWYGLGRCYEALSQQSFEKLGEIAPGSAYWLALAANARMKDQQLSSAFYLYREALAKQPELRGAHAALAEIYQKAGHADWSRTETEREQKLGPPDCARVPMTCNFMAKRYEKVASTRLTTPEAYFWKTKAYNELALQAFAHLAEKPDSVEYHELMAQIHTNAQQARQSVDEWRKTYELSGQDPEIGTQLAVALIQVQDNRGAEDLIEQLLRRQPDSANLNYMLGHVLLSQQEPQQAIASLEKALQLNPQSLQAQDALARAYLQTNQSRKAIPHLKAALPLDQDGSLHYQLARAYQSSGQTELARIMLESYQKIQQATAAERQNTMQEVRITPP